MPHTIHAHKQCHNTKPGHSVCRGQIYYQLCVHIFTFSFTHDSSITHDLGLAWNTISFLAGERTREVRSSFSSYNFKTGNSHKNLH